MTALLFDENLSPPLPRRVAAVFPGGVHIREVGLARADDSAVWDYARIHGLSVVTKDDDFRQRSFLHGAPPKVIWVHLGDCRTIDVVALLNARVAVVSAFLSDPTSSLSVLQPVPARTG